jgi:co-chaperonin GroES (HSP10)
MSDILIGLDPDDPNRYRAQHKEEDIPLEQRGRQLPKPSGFHILCAIPDIEDKFDNGIVKADVTMQHEEILTTVLFVVALGPDAYKDEKRFPSGAWCKEGDFIIVRSGSGTRLDIHGREFRIINDDTVEGVVDDPRGIRRK